ncbi:MAG: glycoside hydrolase family 9 protein [Thermoleophilaceae bacterium]
MLELAMRGTATASLVAGVFGLVGCGSSESIHLRALAGAFVRLNQVGVVAGDRPHAELLAASPLSGAEVSVVQADGHSVASGRLGPDAGAWSAGFAHVYPIDVAPLRSSGTYQLVVRRGAAGVISPRFRVAGAGALYAPLVANALFFMRAQRDGAAVDPGTLSRSPAHLADRSASIVATPSFTGGALRGRLARSGGPVDVSGGWSDAGDYLKFVETASFSDLMILFARRQYPGAFHGAGDRGGQEGRFGLDWLLKMWDPARRRLLYQVGIGDGNGFDVTGTHDLWMLPQASDALDVRPGNPRYFIKYRPVFAANGPVSPNLAGRLAAAFGLCAQLYAKSDPTYAARCLTAGQTVYGAAQTRNVSGLLTTAPRDFYPETEWRDDMALGAAELALGMASAGRSPAYYLARSADWASAYAASTSGAESLNVYDVSALADYELAQALDKLHAPDTLSVTRADLLDDLQSKLADGSTRARADQFRLATRYADGDTVPRALGYAIEAALYDDLTRTKRYEPLGKSQLDWVLGANAWGSSFVVGAGSTFPHCLSHQLANLSGSLDGRPPLLLGATVDGPNAADAFADLSAASGHRRCPANGGDPFAAFSAKGVRYMDDVRASSSAEPAIDYTATAMVALAQAAARGG